MWEECNSADSPEQLNIFRQKTTRNEAQTGSTMTDLLFK